MTETMDVNKVQNPANSDVWERRWHPLREEWVVAAAYRRNRPWNRETAGNEQDLALEYNAGCYLCQRNARVSDSVNDDYQGVYVFDNDLPCIGEDVPSDLQAPAGIYKSRPADGIARVICCSSKHNLSLAQLYAAQIENVIGVWQKQYTELSVRDEVSHVLIFDNKGEEVGVSNPHQHGQIYAMNLGFKTIENEAIASRAYFDETGRGLFEDITNRN